MFHSPAALMTRVGAARLVLGCLGVALALLLATLGVALYRGVGDSPLGASDAAFRLAPDFTAETLDGTTFRLGQHEGSPLFLYFWASWCAPCEREAPLIERLWREYEARGYTFVAVNVMDNRADAVAFARRHGLSFPVVSGGDVYLDYGVVALPEAFFVLPGLRLSGKYIGELREEDFRAMLDALAEGT